MAIAPEPLAMRRIERATEAYESLFGDADVALFVLAEGILECNDAACRLLGRRRDELLGRSPLTFSPPLQPDGRDSAAAARERVASALAGLPQAFQWQFEDRDGVPVEALLRLEAVRLDGATRLLLQVRDLSHLWRAEQALKDTQARLAQILDNANALVFAKDRDGRYLFANRRFQCLLRKREHEILGHDDEDLFGPEMARGYRATDLQVLEAGEARQYEETARLLDGTHTYVSLKFPLLDRRGEPYAVCGIATDITDRKRVEDALRDAALAVSTAEGGAVFRELARYLAAILDVDVTFIASFGAGRESMRTLALWVDGALRENIDYDLEGTPCRLVVGREFQFFPDRLTDLFPTDNMFARLGVRAYAAFPLNDSAGRPLGLVAVVSRRPLANREFIESVLKIFAARASAEIERQRADEARRRSEASYRSIFEASEDAIFIHDWDSGAIVDVNPRACRMYGYSRDEMLRMTVGDLSSGEHPYTEAEAARWIEKAKQGERVQIEWRRRNKDGSLHWDEVILCRADIAGRPHILAITREITERKAAEERLKASEEQYRDIFNGSADALVLWNSALKRVDVNPAYERIYGLTREEILSGDHGDPLPPAERARRDDILRRSLAGETCHVELESFRKNGERFLAEVRTIPIQHRGQPHALAICRDITESRTAEDRLRASEEQYRAMFNASVDGLLLWDADHRIVDVNEAFLALHGFRREDLVGRADPVFIPPDLQEQCAALLPEILGGRPCHLEARTQRKDGTQFDVEIHGIPMLYQGRPHVLIILRDISQRKEHEARLRDSEERYRLLFEMESDAIILADAATLQHIDANRAALELYGYPREELLRLRSIELSAEPDKTQTAMTVGEGTVRVPLRWHRKKDGTVFPVEITANFFELRGRRIMLAAIRDITERKRAEEQRARLETQLRQAQKMEAIGQLTGGIAHDFNNILTSVMGYIALAADRSDAAGDERLARYLGQASASCTRARDLIQQMLTFSRGQRGEPRPLRLAPLVRESVKLLRSSLPATIDIAMDLDDSAPPVLLDPVQLDQVLLNLCINARDAMPDGGRIGVTVRGEALAGGVCSACRGRLDGRFVALTVTDTGHGITPEVLDRMFEPFFSTKEVGKGSGMGLAMAHGIVHDHGGHIVVSSRPGEGAEFRVLLPALSGPAAGAASEQSREAPAPRRPALRGRVLVAEDEPMVAEFMGELLTGWGLEVTLAANGAEARDLFAGDPEQFDLVLTDQTMPVLTGLELARVLMRLRPGVPIVLYTGYGEDLTAAQLEAAGVRALVKKPVDPAELLALLKTHLPAGR